LDYTEDISQEEWETLERYVLNEMTPDERTELESRLSADASLQAKLAEVKLLMVGVGETMLQEKLQAFHRDMPVAEKELRIDKAPASSFKTWLLAASILLVAGVGGWLLLNRGSGSERLFAAHFKPDPGLITAMSATDNYAFEKAMIDYKQGNYAAAIQTWDSLQKGQPANDTLNYFLGVAHLAAKNSKEAIGYLQRVTALPASFFRSDAYWYLGLAHLKEGNKEEAKAAIEQSSHTTKNELLEKLK